MFWIQKYNIVTDTGDLQLKNSGLIGSQKRNEDSAEYNNILQRHLTFFPNPKYIPNNFSLVQSNVRTCIMCVCIQTVCFQSLQKKGVLIWLNNLNKSESFNTVGV